MPTKNEPKIIRSFRKTLGLQVLPDSTILVKAPFLVPKGAIESFIKSNKDWIERRLSLLEQKKNVSKKYEEGEQYLYLGNVYKLKFGSYKEMKFEGEYLYFPDFMKFRIQKEISDFYIKQARKIITEQTEDYAKQMSVSYKSITFSDTKSKWGSCTHDNRLQFCWRLIMAPLLVINYVVVHELAHTLEKNHSHRFWSRVRNYNPSYRQQIKWLKSHGDKLVS